MKKVILLTVIMVLTAEAIFFSLTGCNMSNTYTKERAAQAQAMKDRAEAMRHAASLVAAETEEALAKMKEKQAAAVTPEERDAYTKEIGKYEAHLADAKAVIESATATIEEQQQYLEDSAAGKNQSPAEKMGDVGGKISDIGKLLGGVKGAVTWGVGALLTAVSVFSTNKVNKYVNKKYGAAQQAKFSNLIAAFQRILDNSPSDEELELYLERAPSGAKETLKTVINEATWSKQDLENMLRDAETPDTKIAVAQAKAALTEAKQKAGEVAAATTGKVSVVFKQIGETIEKATGKVDAASAVADAAVTVAYAVVPAA